MRFLNFNQSELGDLGIHSLYKLFILHNVNWLRADVNCFLKQCNIQLLEFQTVLLSIFLYHSSKEQEGSLKISWLYIGLSSFVF